MERPAFIPAMISTGFGSGLSPFAPGTAGAILATLMWWVASLFMEGSVLCLSTILVTAAITFAGIWATNRVIPYWGEDPSRVVVDEMVGVWIPLCAVFPGEWELMLASLVLFRIFDIFKPLGIRRMERLPDGIGVMMDDVLAGVYSLVIILAARWVI